MVPYFSTCSMMLLKWMGKDNRFVGGNTLFVGGSDAGNDKSLVNVNTTTDLIHNF